MVPTSKKGRGAASRTARRSRSRPVSRPGSRPPPPAAPPSAPLLLRADGAPWQPKIADHRPAFQQAAAPPVCPQGRRSTRCGISRSRGRCCAASRSRSSPTGTTRSGQIEGHYGRFIKHHYDELVRAALLDTAPAGPADVVPLRRA